MQTTAASPLFDPQRLATAEADAQAKAIEALGYSPREARFLATVACAGGYFLRRHYATALGIARGGSDASLISRLTQRRHASRYGFCRAEQVFHLSAAACYPDAETAGRGRATRPRPATTIARRLMALDAMLAHPEASFVCGQSNRIALCERAGLAVDQLPARTFHPAKTTKAVVRVLPDLPLLGCLTDATSPTLVAAYVAEPGETTSGFATYMTRHAPLFASGIDWRVWYICTTARQADTARRTFDTKMSADIRAGAAILAELAAEYGDLRALYEAQRWQELDTTRIRRLFELKRRFGADADRIYATWRQHQAHQRGNSVKAAARPSLPLEVRRSLSPRATFEPIVLAHRYTALEPLKGLR